MSALHTIGTDLSADREIYHEPDKGFRSASARPARASYIVIATGDNETSEVRLLPANDPFAKPVLVAPRKTGREYDVDEHDGTLFILTNDTHENFRLATAPLADPGGWTTLIAGSDRFLPDRRPDLPRFLCRRGPRGRARSGRDAHYNDPARIERIAFPDASYTAGLDDNPEYDRSTSCACRYESMVTPGHRLRLRRRERRS